MSEIDRFKRNYARRRAAMQQAGRVPTGDAGASASGNAAGANGGGSGGATGGTGGNLRMRAGTGRDPRGATGIAGESRIRAGVNPRGAAGVNVTSGDNPRGVTGAYGMRANAALGIDPRGAAGVNATSGVDPRGAVGIAGVNQGMRIGAGVNPRAAGTYGANAASEVDPRISSQTNPNIASGANPGVILGIDGQPILKGGMPPMRAAIGEADIRKANETLARYKSGKSMLDRRVINCEQWWKRRHWDYLDDHGNENDDRPASAWLFNCIISKHADGIEAYPEPNIRPREAGDKDEAKKLSSIIPVVLEQNGFDETYSAQLWQKLKQGTGIYGVFWDKEKLNGLGDITISKIDVLNIFWEPGITDIQRARNVFMVELMDIDLLKETYAAQIGDRSIGGHSFQPARYIHDDTVDTSDKATVIDWYYRKTIPGPDGLPGRRVLHYVKYVDDIILYATENDPALAERGLYDDALYPFVFDPLFPIEGSPCGYGYIDIGKGPQGNIDRLKQAILKNAMMSATPRFFYSGAAKINEKEFLDWTKPLVRVEGGAISDTDIREITLHSLNELPIEVMASEINEMKETTGNRDANTGGTAPGVTAASAIVAMQEQAGKTSKASTLSAYRAFGRLATMVIERIRQFYDQPREFRILGEAGGEEYVSYTNEGIVPQQLPGIGASDMGMRLPVFDVEVSAQKMSTYTKIAQNELAIQLFKLGVLSPQNTDQSLALLDIMDFAHKGLIEDKVRKNGTMYQLLAQYQQMALTLAMQSGNVQAAEMIAANIQQVQAGLTGTIARAGAEQPTQLQAIDKAAEQEPKNLRVARARAQRSARPER